MTSLVEYLRIVANAKKIKKWPPPVLIPSLSLLIIIIHVMSLFPEHDLSHYFRFER